MRVGPGPWIAFALGALAACGGGGSTPEPQPEVVRASAVRQVVDGAALQQTVIEITFERPLEAVTRDAPVSTFFDVEVPSATALDGNETLHPVSARIDGDQVFLTMARPIPTGTVVFVAGGFFGTDGVDAEADVASTMTTFNAALASTALAPTDTAIVPDGAEPPAPGPDDANPAAMKELMLEHMRRRGSTEDTLARAALNFDSIDPAVVPSPRLRAALAGLTGSFAEPAIEDLLTTDNCTGLAANRIDFGEIPDGESLVARVIYAEDGSRMVLFQPTLAGERIELLMPLLAHEAIHCDQADPVEEEIAATAFDTFLYLQLLTVDPSIAMTGTPLTRLFNLDAIAMVNSGRRYPESIGILPSDGIAGVFPGSNSQAGSFAEVVANAYPTLGSDPEAEAEPLAQTYAELVRFLTDEGPGDVFDLVWLDALLGAAFDSQSMAAVLVALTLGPPP
jgi:hypothetical protein